MAGLKGICQGTAQIAASTTKKTLFQITAPTNQRLVIKEIMLSVKSAGYGAMSSEDKSCFVEVEEQTTAGTGTTANPAKWDPTADETLQATAARNHSAAPTSSTVKLSQHIHPYLGEPFIWRAPSDSAQDGIIVKGGGRLGIAVTHQDASLTWDYQYNVIYEE